MLGEWKPPSSFSLKGLDPSSEKYRRALILKEISEMAFSGKSGLDMRLRQLALDQISTIPNVEGRTYRAGVDFKTNQPIYKERSDISDAIRDKRILNVCKYIDVVKSLFEYARENGGTTLRALDNEGYISLVNEFKTKSA